VIIPAGGEGRGHGGRVVLRDGDKLRSQETQEITVLGEVQSPTSHVFEPGRPDEYIAKAAYHARKADRSGFTSCARTAMSSRAAHGRLVSGVRKTWRSPRRHGRSTARHGAGQGTPLVAGVTTIIYNLAVAFAAVRSV